MLNIKPVRMIVFSLLFICALVCAVFIIKSTIKNLLLLQTDRSPPSSAPLKRIRQNLFDSPPQIPLNKATILSAVKYKLSAAAPFPVLEYGQRAASEHIINTLTHCYQTWNNCGPASLSMLLSAFDIKVSQEEIGSQLRPHPQDKHTSITELARYAEEAGLFAAHGWGGSENLIKELIAAGVPVMLKIGLDPPDDDWMCHYVIVTGYSDKKAQFILMDSLYGSYYPYSYGTTAEFWTHFMWSYLIIVPKEKQRLVTQLIDNYADSAAGSVRLRQRVYHDLTAKPASAFAWYNLSKFLLPAGQRHAALVALETAFDYGLPWRLSWYDTAMYEIYLQNHKYHELMQLTLRVLSRNPYSEEAHYYRAQALLNLDKKDNAFAELNKALEINPAFEPARTLLKLIKALP